MCSPELLVAGALTFLVGACVAIMVVCVSLTFLVGACVALTLLVGVLFLLETDRAYERSHFEDYRV